MAASVLEGGREGGRERRKEGVSKQKSYRDEREERTDSKGKEEKRKQGIQPTSVSIARRRTVSRMPTYSLASVCPASGDKRGAQRCRQ